ncbi:MAG: FHA domain-containing serine/threonine-protein kinase [Leptolyngbyaceae cyanobacterium bins.302]|nr:FHA domain-containing serine/threonine-protein kinase [Leptolyngbyaceae cyanobacterium bins.302]
MVNLTLLHPQSLKPLRQWQFGNATLIRVGRAPENHVILNDPVVSRFHLELRRVERSKPQPEPITYVWQLVNQSMNGTFLNGVEVTQATLEDQAVLQLAENGPLLRFELEERSSPSVANLSHPASSNVPRSSMATPTHCTHAGNAPDNLFCVHCGQPIQIEKTVRQYQVLRTLGRGGMGTTYLVWNADETTQPVEMPTGRLQVLKEMNADVAQIPKAQELFEREASTLKTLSHPGIPRYYDFFIEADKKYLVMELVHGRDMERRIRQEGRVSVEQAIGWMIQTCEVLDYLHTRPTPMIHRDIKPGNLIVRNLDRRVVVLDFGAVKAAGMPPGTRIGAEGYSAPEQIQGRPMIQSDLFAIGPSLAYLLTGLHPLRLQKREDPYHRLDLEKIEGLPRRLKFLIQRVMEPNPGDRYKSAKELIRALKSCL